MTVQYSPLSQCNGKIRYRTRRWAKQAIVEMRAHGHHTATLSAYLCPHCGFFHIGNRPAATG